MEPINELKISIPKPCHEDWNKMTQNQQGAFCGKCCKTVVDFTNKTPDEIKNTLLERNGKKVCGRFMSDQLDEKPKKNIHLNIPLYLLPKNISYRKAFAIALFFVFGTTLFSCTTSDDHTVGKIAVVDTTKTTQPQSSTNDTIKKTQKILGDTIFSAPVKKPVMGGVKNAHPVCRPLQGDVEVEIEPITKGEVVAVNDTITKVTTPKDSAVRLPTMGKIKMSK